MSRAAVGLLLGLVLTSCQTTMPTGPIMGSWHGTPPGPDPAVSQLVDLTLYGQPGASSGQYAISTTVRGTFFSGTNRGVRTWSGTWIKEQQAIDGRPQTVIYLKDALASDINQYFLAANGSLEPTPAYLGRDLTPQEIRIYSLQPLPGRRAATL